RPRGSSSYPIARDDGPEAARDRPSPALPNRDRDLGPERILRTARVAAYSSRDERILPGSERAFARKCPGRNRSRQSPPWAPVEEHPGRLIRPRDRVIDRVATDLVRLILRLHEDESQELPGIGVALEHVA